MKVLIVDDYDSTRSLLRRILVRDYQCAVVEAANGVEALAAIASHRFTFVLLDVQMPIMDGIETLQAIRRSSEQPHLPIVMLTAVRDEATVRRIAALGITDYLTKPLKAEHIAGRLARVVAAVSRRGHRFNADDLRLDQQALVLLADGDGDFRHFFADVMAPMCTVATAESGAHALKLALHMPPRVIFLGATLGALGHDLFLAKMRELPPLKSAAVVAIVPKTGMEQARHSREYDGVLARTFVREVFIAQIERLFHANTALQRIIARQPNLRVNLITAIEQVFGMMLSSEVALLPASLDPDEGGTGLGVTSTVVLAVPDLHLDLDVQVSGGLQAAGALAAALTGTPEGDLAAEDVEGAIQEVANMIAGRLQLALSEHGMPASCGVPQTGTGPLAVSPVDGDEALTVNVESAGGARFRMSVLGRNTVLLAAAAPAERGRLTA